MNWLTLLFFVSVVLFQNCSLFAQTNNVLPPVIYIHPLPDSKNNSPNSNIAIRFDTSIDLSMVSGSDFTISGSKSGNQSAQFRLSDDGRTVILNPTEAFSRSETVSVRYISSIASEHKHRISDFSFRFSTAREPAAPLDVNQLRKQMYLAQSGNGVQNGSSHFPRQNGAPDIPPGLITVTLSNNPSPGNIFLSNFRLSTSEYTGPPSLLIVDNAGAPVFYDEKTTMNYDFKMQPNGRLTYWNTDFHILDSAYREIGRIACRNGYSTDPHELLLLPNGHALLLGFDVVTMDLSKIVPGGRTSATVIGLVIQEQDTAKNTLFQWRSFDHFEITDATNLEFSDLTIDVVHGNALDIDADGNILLSSRNLDEITKINRTTGRIMWRLGGKNNQFTFVNDSIGFSRQHSVRVLNNGNITLYDNGNYHSPPFSRAVEYAIDTVKMTATLVWQYRNTPDIFGNALGNVQRLPNGNTLICWGSTNPAITEVTSRGSKVFELELPAGIYTYRSFRSDWQQKTTGIMPLLTHPMELQLYQNFPNPFNPTTRIRYTTMEGPARLSLFNLLGQEIRVLSEGYVSAGNHEQTIDAASLASGMYFCRLRQGLFVRSIRISLVK